MREMPLKSCHSSVKSLVVAESRGKRSVPCTTVCLTHPIKKFGTSLTFDQSRTISIPSISIALEAPLSKGLEIIRLEFNDRQHLFSGDGFLQL